MKGGQHPSPGQRKPAPASGAWSAARRTGGTILVGLSAMSATLGLAIGVVLTVVKWIGLALKRQPAQRTGVERLNEPQPDAPKRRGQPADSRTPRRVTRNPFDD